MGNGGDDEQAKAERFGGANASSDDGAELCGVSDGEFALKLNGGVRAVSAGLVEELSPARNGAERIGVLTQ